MKKRIGFAAMAAIMALLAAGCGLPKETGQTPEDQPAGDATRAVVFADPQLERAVRAAMGKPEGDITVTDAEAVTRLSLDAEWQPYLDEDTPIRDIGGLESFSNLAILDLSFQEISDLTPLSGLTNLKVLALSGNPVTDLAPLSGLTNLNVLTFSRCTAQDYGPLSKLTHLKYLDLEQSTLSDVSLLAALTELTRLDLSGCPVTDYSPLADLYLNLTEKDFKMVSTLADYGFLKAEGSSTADYDRDGISIKVQHAAWGPPSMDMEGNSVSIRFFMKTGYELYILYYPEIDVYVIQTSVEETVVNYIYDLSSSEPPLDDTARIDTEQALRQVLGEVADGDILYAPIPVFNDTIQSIFGTTADTLYALPYESGEETPVEQPTASYATSYERLGFSADLANAVCVYEQFEPHDLRIAIHRPEWGENADGWNMEFFDSDINGYQLRVLYYDSEGKYHVSIEKDGAEAGFEIYPATGEKGWEYPDLETAHAMFNTAFKTTGKELYYKPIDYLEQAIEERFGMRAEELYALTNE